MEFAYEHIKKENKKLLVIFNDMSKVGLDKSFSPYTKIIDAFTDYDFLFIKDVDKGEWYLIIYEKVKKIIENISLEYDYVFGLSSSSGTVCLLNILEEIKNHKKSIIVNGQVDITKDFIKMYENAHDCIKFNFEKVNNKSNKILKKDINIKLLSPIKKILKNNNLNKYIFYYNKSVSDFVYYTYLETLFDEQTKKTNLFLDTENYHDHSGHIIYCFSSENFFKKINETFDSTIQSQV